MFSTPPKSSTSITWAMRWRGSTRRSLARPGGGVRFYTSSSIPPALPMPSARPIRVALVAYRDDPAAGGSLRVAETLAQFLPADEVEAHLVFAYGPPGPVAARVPVPVHCLGA